MTDVYINPSQLKDALLLTIDGSGKGLEGNIARQNQYVHLRSLAESMGWR